METRILDAVAMKFKVELLTTKPKEYDLIWFNSQSIWKKIMMILTALGTFFGAQIAAFMMFKDKIMAVVDKFRGIYDRTVERVRAAIDRIR